MECLLVLLLAVHASYSHPQTSELHQTNHSQITPDNETELPSTYENVNTQTISCVGSRETPESLQRSEFIKIIHIYSNNDTLNGGDTNVFDISSYNNTCVERKEVTRRSCFVHGINTAEIEMELCDRFSEIVRSSYIFSCCYNVPEDDLLNKTSEYVQKCDQLLLGASGGVKGSVACGEGAEIVANLGVMLGMTKELLKQHTYLYSLPKSRGMTIHPVEIPTLLKLQEKFVTEETAYLQILVNLTHHMTQHQLARLFPFLYDLYIDTAQSTWTDLRQDAGTLKSLRFLDTKSKEFNEAYDRLDRIKLVLSAILFFLGIFLNSLLLSIFILFRETRTHANALLINLAVVDFISLVFNLLVYHVVDTYFFLRTGCVGIQILSLIREVSHIVSVFSVVMLAYQRFRAASQVAVSGTRRKTRTALEVSAVWLLGFIYYSRHLAFLTVDGDHCEYNEGQYEFLLLNIQLIVQCVLPIILFAIFCVMASVRLKKSVANIPGERHGQQMQLMRDRMVTSRVLFGLIVLIAISYLPNSVAYYVYTEEMNLLEPPTTSRYVFDITYILMFLNSALNPLAIFLLSRRFRNYLSRIFSCCGKKPRVPKVELVCQPQVSEGTTQVSNVSSGHSQI